MRTTPPHYPSLIPPSSWGCLPQSSALSSPLPLLLAISSSPSCYSSLSFGARLPVCSSSPSSTSSLSWPLPCVSPSSPHSCATRRAVGQTDRRYPPRFDSGPLLIALLLSLLFSSFSRSQPSRPLIIPPLQHLLLPLLLLLLLLLMALAPPTPRHLAHWWTSILGDKINSWEKRPY